MNRPAFAIRHAIALAFCVAGFMASVTAAVPVIDDAAMWQKFADAIGEGSFDPGNIRSAALRERLSNPSRSPVRLARAGRRELDADAVYSRDVASVVAIASVYKCDKCTRWHTAGTASGWVVGDRGEIVSNYHVFDDARGTNLVATGVMTRDGHAYPVHEVVWVDRARDIAVVRVETLHLMPLALERDEPVGRRVAVIAHPGGDLFTFTQGHVARYMKRAVEPGAAPVEWMCVTADYAVGSSGGPILNSRGSVVGMVARTHTIAADPHNGATTQMVVKMGVPSSAILDVLGGK